MDGAPTHTSRPPPLEQRRLAEIADYYDEATPDYRHWSAVLHMHFGCWRWPLSPFDRTAMVEQLSHDVLDRLTLAKSGTVVDLGCGVGSSARLLARSRPSIEVLGLSLSAAQVELGNHLSERASLRERVELRVGDYRATSLPSGSAIGAYAIESSCYDPDHGAGLIREAARILEPGARLIVADAFRRRAWMPRAARALERRMSAGWQLPGLSELDRFRAHLHAHGFDCTTEDISLRVAPTVLQVPFVTLGFRIREGFGLAIRREANARAPIWGMLCALLFPRRFGYFILTATRRADPCDH